MGDAACCPVQTVRSWKELRDVEESYNEHKWAFRGQNTFKFPSSSLERHCIEFGFTGDGIIDLEVKLIRDFARRYHLYSGSTPPQKGNTLEWLSLMQHYGVPTRLTDFTYSFMNAVFFALEEKGNCLCPIGNCTCPSVWVIDRIKLLEEADKLIKASMNNLKDPINSYNEKRDKKSFRDLFINEQPKKFVYPVNPIRFNDRLTNQQGVFLTPGDVRCTFKENLKAIPKSETIMVRVAISDSKRSDILERLHRLGINRASLFPGLEGYARSLRTKSLILRHLDKQNIDMLKQV
ncbi:MAG TPA: FRG domain-containing protein [Syntrophales bacterium]|nr:FRG domain-containing protein [Syntrophales bacterium]